MAAGSAVSIWRRLLTSQVVELCQLLRSRNEAKQAFSKCEGYWTDFSESVSRTDLQILILTQLHNLVLDARTKLLACSKLVMEKLFCIHLLDCSAQETIREDQGALTETEKGRACLIRT